MWKFWQFFSVRSFYSYVLESDVTFLANNTMSAGPMARFTELAETPLLTLNMITPEGWMVQALRSPHDLDNIHLQEVYRCPRLTLIWPTLSGSFLFVCYSKPCCHDRWVGPWRQSMSLSIFCSRATVSTCRPASLLVDCSLPWAWVETLSCMTPSSWLTWLVTYSIPGFTKAANLLRSPCYMYSTWYRVP